MAVTTEPPWLNKSVGIAARNGTASHTITFSTDGDAPFTPTNGSLLVFICFGAVTHTVSAGGWTEQLQPVNSAELSVFTVTASSTTAITVAHNGSNYPIAWVIKEYPAGSTYVSGTSSTTSADTFPALSGLTGGSGNEVVIEAARGRSQTSVAVDSASATWSAPWVEDADLYTSNTGTEGFAFTAGHQINVTTTSVTPAATATYGIDARFTADREKVVFAINAAATSSTTNGTATVTGAGTVTALARQGAGATVTGAGTASAAATVRAGATVTGAGTAAALATQSAASTVTGAGAVTAAAQQRAGATVTGAGTVTALSRQTAGSTVTGAGTVNADGVTAIFGTATVTGAGMVTALAATRSTSTVTGAGTVTADAAGQTFGTATVAGAGTVTALASTRSSATVTGAGVVSALGANRGSASVVGAGTVTALARQSATALVAGLGAVTASAGQTTFGTASVVGVGVVTASAGSRITPRPDAGITVRPSSGTTARPYSGITPRP